MNTIRNVEQLRSEIIVLKRLVAEKQAEIKPRFSGTKAIFHTILSIFPKNAENGEHQWKKWLRPVLRLVPAITIKLFLKRSSFIMQSLVGLAGQMSSRFLKND